MLKTARDKRKAAYKKARNIWRNNVPERIRRTIGVPEVAYKVSPSLLKAFTEPNV